MESSKVVYTLPAEDMRLGHRMEGMTIDCKFKLWVALNGAGCILRIDPWKETEISRLTLGLSQFNSSLTLLIICILRNMLFLFGS